jgi:ankyrin repeat protein
MHIAAACGNVRMLTLFVLNASNINPPDDQGQTPVHVCTSNMGDCTAKAKCLRILAEHGAFLDAADAFGFTALHYACDAGNVPATRALLEAGCDIFTATPVRFGVKGCKELHTINMICCVGGITM